LGVMGSPMARNLGRAGFDVVAFSRTPASRERAAVNGVHTVDKFDEAVDEADVVITMLPDSPDVAKVVAQYLVHARVGTLIIDMSTIDPEATLVLHTQCAERGVSYIDAPVSGGQPAAIEGTLSIMVGGLEADVAAARDILAAMGTTVVHVGGPGSGQVVKAANQLIVAGNIQMLAEALVFLDAHDVQLNGALDVLAGGLAGSTVLTRKRGAMLSEDYAPGFRLSLHNKDLSIVEKASRGAGVSLPLTAVVTQLVRSLIARGDGELDHSALYKLARELNGTLEADADRS
jgi:2-hydroxy-3-oxopropionate reductase